MKFPRCVLKNGFLAVIKDVKLRNDGNEMIADVDIKTYNLWKYGIALVGFICGFVLMELVGR